MKSVLFLLIAISILTFVALLFQGCAKPDPKQEEFLKKLNELNSGDLVTDQFRKELAPYLTESLPNWSKYHVSFAGGCGCGRREYWITINDENSVLQVYRKNE